MNGNSNSMIATFLDVSSVDRGDLDMSLLSNGLPSWSNYDYTNGDDVIDRIMNVDIVVTNKVVLNEKALNQAKKLKLICVAATGTNNIDLQAARKNNIAVCNVKAYATNSVVQHVFMLILALMTRLNDYRNAVQSGSWGKSRHFCLLDYPIVELSGKNIGIIGYGELGQAVAKMARSFGMNVLVAARKGDSKPKLARMPFYDVLRMADVLSLHCPLENETKHLIAETELNTMKSSSILINTARGGIVDEMALAIALKSSRIAGAGIDVLTKEPPSNANPLLDKSIPNLIITPHIAWASKESRQRLIDEISFNIQSYLRGFLRNSVF